MPSHSTHINYYTRPACMGLGTLKITNFPIINRTAGLRSSTDGPSRAMVHGNLSKV